MQMSMSFPKSRLHLWDGSPTGNWVDLSFTKLGWPRIVLRRNVLQLAERSCKSRGRHHCFLMGHLRLTHDEGPVLEVNRYDPGRVWRGAEGEEEFCPTAPSRGEVPLRSEVRLDHHTSALAAPDEVCVGGGGPDLMYNTAQLERALQEIAGHCREGGPICPEQLMDARAVISVGNTSVKISCGCVVPAAVFQASPVSALPMVPTPLARGLAGPLQQAQQGMRSGFLTMEETRKLVLLLDTDTKASVLPLVGLWVCGVSSIYHALVWTACLNYIHSRRLSDRVFAEGKWFLVVLYVPSSPPQFWQCRLKDSKEFEVMTGVASIDTQSTTTSSSSSKAAVKVAQPQRDEMVIRMLPDLDSSALPTLLHSILLTQPHPHSHPHHHTPLSQGGEGEGFRQNSLYGEDLPQPTVGPCPTPQQAPEQLYRSRDLSLHSTCDQPPTTGSIQPGSIQPGSIQPVGSYTVLQSSQPALPPAHHSTGNARAEDPTGGNSLENIPSASSTSISSSSSSSSTTSSSTSSLLSTVQPHPPTSTESPPLRRTPLQPVNCNTPPLQHPSSSSSRKQKKKKVSTAALSTSSPANEEEVSTALDEQLFILQQKMNVIRLKQQQQQSPRSSNLASGGEGMRNVSTSVGYSLLGGVPPDPSLTPDTPCILPPKPPLPILSSTTTTTAIGSQSLPLSASCSRTEEDFSACWSTSALHQPTAYMPTTSGTSGTSFDSEYSSLSRNHGQQHYGNGYRDRHGDNKKNHDNGYRGCHDDNNRSYHDDSGRSHHSDNNGGRHDHSGRRHHDDNNGDRHDNSRGHCFPPSSSVVGEEWVGGPHTSRSRGVGRMKAFSELSPPVMGESASLVARVNSRPGIEGDHGRWRVQTRREDQQLYRDLVATIHQLLDRPTEDCNHDDNDSHHGSGTLTPSIVEVGDFPQWRSLGNGSPLHPGLSLGLDYQPEYSGKISDSSPSDNLFVYKPTGGHFAMFNPPAPHPEVSLLPVPLAAADLDSTGVSMFTACRDADTVALKYLQSTDGPDLHPSGVTMASKDLSLATQDYFTRQGLQVFPGGRQQQQQQQEIVDDNILDVDHLRQLPKLL